MSSAPSGRYQSRLFNFLHQQSRRLTEISGRGLRHLRVAAIWSIQLLLSPIYLLLESTELAGRRFNPKTPSTWLQLSATQTDSQSQTPPSTDTAIQQVLSLVETLSLKQVEEPNLLVGEAQSARSLKQQRPVIRAIATQLSNRGLVLVTAQNEILDILTPQQQQKLQNRIIQAVANDSNHWQQPAFADSSRQEKLPNPAQYPIIAFLDRTLAQLESVYLSRKPQLVNHDSQSISENLNNAHPSSIQALIWAAVQFFFGDSFARRRHRTRQSVAGTTPNFSLPKNEVSGILQGTEEDPWLSESDLFGHPEAQQQQGEESRTQLAVSQSREIQPTKATVDLQKLISDKKISDHAHSLKLDSKFDWIETPITETEYVKHRLERVLGWLDWTMLWLEERLIKVVQWLQQLWRR